MNLTSASRVRRRCNMFRNGPDSPECGNKATRRIAGLDGEFCCESCFLDMLATGDWSVAELDADYPRLTFMGPL